LRPSFKIEAILSPKLFAKSYAVTLYEILEAYVNRRDASVVVDIAEFRGWLKVPEESYAIWRDLRRFVIDPAIKEINDNAEDAGFFVAYEGVREGKAFSKIRFAVTKTAARDERDEALQRGADRARTFKGGAAPMIENAFYSPPDHVLEQLRTHAPGWDRQALVAQFNEWKRNKQQPANPDGCVYRKPYPS
jgi:plasmid replication initiation protein